MGGCLFLIQPIRFDIDHFHLWRHRFWIAEHQTRSVWESKHLIRTCKLLQCNVKLRPQAKMPESRLGATRADFGNFPKFLHCKNHTIRINLIPEVRSPPYTKLSSDTCIVQPGQTQGSLYWSFLGSVPPVFLAAARIVAMILGSCQNCGYDSRQLPEMWL